LYNDQSDPGWWLIKIMECFGWVKNIRIHSDLPERHELVCLSEDAGFRGHYG